MNDGPADREFRRRIAKSTNVPAPHAKIRKRLLQSTVPRFSASSGLNGDDTGRELSILRKKRRLEDIDRFDAAHGNGRAEAAAGRIRDVT